MKPLPLVIAVGSASLMIGLYAGWAMGHRQEGPSSGYALRDTDASYTYVEPLIACNVGATAESEALDNLQKEFADTIDAATEHGDAEQASVYYRDLRSGEWTAVNLETGYSPASLMKLPILMAYLKQAELDDDLLEQTVTVDEDPTPNTAQDIPPEEYVHVGETYTIEELLELMIVHSDNRALEILMTSIDAGILHELLEDLNLPQPGSMDNYTMTARSYSRFFRTLFNGSYLSPAMSERALTMLAQAEYADGLVAGVPETVDVAHKFGEASTELADGSTGHELHDCGIVYSDTPFLMCVMTKGAEVNRLAALIAELTTIAQTATNK